MSANQLKANYAWCRRVCKESNSSFVSSFALLEKPRRQAMQALYAFSRITDDLGDSVPEEGARRELLDNWRKLTEASLEQQDTKQLAESMDEQLKCLENGVDWNNTALLWPAFAHSMKRFEIPKHLPLDIVTGVERDIDQQQPKTMDELDQYCYYVASAVGLACTYIWRADDRPAIKDNHELSQAAIDCGIAFQLTNILRDVSEDARNGRIYLPSDAFSKYQIDQTKWLAGQPDGSWQELIEEVAVRAEGLYQSGWQVNEMLAPKSQRMFSLIQSTMNGAPSRRSRYGAW